MLLSVVSWIVVSVAQGWWTSPPSKLRTRRTSPPSKRVVARTLLTSNDPLRPSIQHRPRAEPRRDQSRLPATKQPSRQWRWLRLLPLQLLPIDGTHRRDQFFPAPRQVKRMTSRRVLRSHSDSRESRDNRRAACKRRRRAKAVWISTTSRRRQLCGIHPGCA